MLLVSCLLIGFFYATAALGATLKGKITAIIGSDIVVQLDGALKPRPGDPVEVVFGTPDGDEVPVGTWTVTKVDGKKVRAKKKEAFGSAEVGYAAIIDSANPVQPRAAQASKKGDTAETPPKGPMRASIGVRIKDAKPEYGVKGALVVSVTQGGPAATAGVRSGDIIVEYNAGEIKTWQDLPKRVQAGRPDNPVLVTLLRNGDRRQLIIVPEARSLAAIRQPPDAREMRDILDRHYQSARAFYTGKDRNKDYAKAYKMFLEAARDGHVDSMVMVGAMNELGRHVTKNRTAAVSWYRKAADAGSAWGQTNLGIMYEYGRGVKRNYREAARWYGKAAKQNYATGITYLGELYENGNGFRRNYAEAARLYQKAADAGNVRAVNNLAKLYETGKGVTRDYRKAVSLYERAVKKGSGSALNRLGWIHQKGKTGRANMRKAVDYYRRAAEKGNTAGQTNYGFMLMNSLGVERDDQEAARWFRRAAKKGDGMAMFNMGYLHSLGRLGRPNLKAAEKWFLDAEKNDRRVSLFVVAQSFDGKVKKWGFPTIPRLAQHFYKRAAARGDSRARKYLSELESQSDSYSTDE